MRVDCPDTRSTTSQSVSLPKSKIKKNDFLESIRTMINSTVTESVALASSDLRDEIHQMRSSFDSKLNNCRKKKHGKWNQVSRYVANWTK